MLAQWTEMKLAETGDCRIVATSLQAREQSIELSQNFIAKMSLREVATLIDSKQEMNGKRE